MNTYAVTALDPKRIVFFVASLPQFIDPGADLSRQLWVLSVSFVLMATISSASG